MGEAAAVSLTVGQVIELINRAKTGEANPVVVGMQMFNNLGDYVSVTGSTLLLALTQSNTKIDPLFMPLVNAIQTMSKNKAHVSVSLAQPVEVQKKIKVDFAQEMSFDVSNDGGSPALNNVQGLSGHMGILGAPVKAIQLSQNQGHWTVAVKTPWKTFDFDLG
jgi:hypothetical protein